MQTVLLVAILVSLTGPEASQAVSKARLPRCLAWKNSELEREKRTTAGFLEQNWTSGESGESAC